MKRQRAPLEVFSLSFLDIISCAFGAVVMLILLAKNGEEGEFSDVSQVADALSTRSSIEAKIAELEQSIAEENAAQASASATLASNNTQADALEAEIAKAKNQLKQLTDKANGLEIKQQVLEQAAISVGDAKERDEEVGGIPVDSDYVIFIIDTSGSMKSMWTRVLNKMEQVLEIHPKVTGFQILSDNGDYLLRQSTGRWRNDTEATRRSVLAAMRNWSGSSNSSPVEGIQTALKTYGKRVDSLSLYVFGDDFSGGSLDLALEQINNLNRDDSGKLIARIHAVGFAPQRSGITRNSLMFSTLMREVAKQNNGTFIAQN